MVMRRAAHIVLSVSVVYFISFIGRVWVRGLSLQGEIPNWPLDLDFVIGGVPHPQGWPRSARASLRLNLDAIVKCQDVHYQSQMLF